MTVLGTVTELIRYPVKSMQGEFTSSMSIRTYGVEGDRIFAWERKGKQGDYLTIPDSPFLLDYEVHLNEEGKLKFTKEGVLHQNEDVKTYVSEKTGAAVSLLEVDPIQSGPSYWDSPLLITTKASLTELKKLCGREQMDMLRFRPNLVVNLEDAEPFSEESWIGKDIKINDVVLHIEKGCERCAYVNFDSTTKEVDTNVLKTVVKENKQIFGVYASVKKTGTINEDDTIELLGN